MTNQSKYRVSVVIPVYNAGAYIGRAIDSVLGQSHRADEIIVVDDGSRDNTAGEVARFGEKVRYIYQGNAGASAARNAGIKAAKYEWIAFLDGDDEWLENKLELQMELLQANPKLQWAMTMFYFCSCNSQTKKAAPANAVRKKIPAINDFFDLVAQGLLCSLNDFIIKKSLLQQAGFFRIGQLRHNDIDTWWSIAYIDAKIGFVSKPLSIYHIDIADSITRKYSDIQIFYDLLDRHIGLAERAGAAERFIGCLRYLLVARLRGMIFEADKKNIRFIINHYKNYLPGRVRYFFWFLSIWPRLTQASVKNIRGLLRLCGKGKIVRKNIDAKGKNLCLEKLKNAKP